MIDLNFNGHRCVYCGEQNKNEERKGEAAFICDECNKPGGKREMDTLRIGIST